MELFFYNEDGHCICARVFVCTCLFVHLNAAVHVCRCLRFGKCLRCVDDAYMHKYNEDSKVVSTLQWNV